MRARVLLDASFLGNALRLRRCHTGVIVLSHPRVTFRMCPQHRWCRGIAQSRDARRLSTTSMVQCHGLVSVGLSNSVQCYGVFSLVSPAMCFYFILSLLLCPHSRASDSLELILQ